MLKYLTGAYTASGDTTKTSLGTITTPSSTRAIVGVWVQWGGAGMTTLEDVSGILELESNDVNIQPCQIPLTAVMLTGTGAAPMTPKVWPLNINKAGQIRITGYVTMDITLAINPGVRFGLVIETSD